MDNSNKNAAPAVDEKLAEIVRAMEAGAGVREYMNLPAADREKVLERLRKVEQPLLGSGKPAHGPG